MLIPNCHRIYTEGKNAIVIDFRGSRTNVPASDDFTLYIHRSSSDTDRLPSSSELISMITGVTERRLSADGEVLFEKDSAPSCVAYYILDSLGQSSHSWKISHITVFPDNIKFEFSHIGNFHYQVAIELGKGFDWLQVGLQPRNNHQETSLSDEVGIVMTLSRSSHFSPCICMPVHGRPTFTCYHADVVTWDGKNRFVGSVYGDDTMAAYDKAHR